MVIFGSDMNGLDLEVKAACTLGITPAHPELTWLARAQGGEAHPPERETPQKGELATVASFGGCGEDRHQLIEKALFLLRNASLHYKCNCPSPKGPFMPIHSCSYSVRITSFRGTNLSPAVKRKCLWQRYETQKHYKPIVTNRKGGGCPLPNMHAHSYFCDGLHRHSAVSAPLAPL
jgi:hypothetical protein